MKINEIDKAKINDLPPAPAPRNVDLINKSSDLGKVEKWLGQQSVIGIDTEHPPNFKAGENKPVSLVQIASADQVFIIQVQKTGKIGLLTQWIKQPEIRKIGIALQSDLSFFHPLSPAARASFIDLAVIAKHLGLQRKGLKSMTATFFGWKVSKGQQTSNWGADKLSKAQVSYAALDAWLPLMIYRKIEGQGYLDLIDLDL